MEPPELRSLDAEPREMKLLDHVEYVLAQVCEVTERLQDVGSMREMQGRSPSKQTTKRAAALAVALAGASRMIEQAKAEHDALSRLYLEFQEITTRGRR
jgi:hypothetical protein